MQAAADLVDHDVVRVGLEQLGRQLPRLLDDVLGGPVHGHAPELERARAEPRERQDGQLTGESTRQHLVSGLSCAQQGDGSEQAQAYPEPAAP